MNSLLLNLVKEVGIVKIINNNVDDLHREDHRVKFQRTLDEINGINYGDDILSPMYYSSNIKLDKRSIFYYMFRRPVGEPDLFRTSIHHSDSWGNHNIYFGGTDIYEYKNLKVDVKFFIL